MLQESFASDFLDALRQILKRNREGTIEKNNFRSKIFRINLCECLSRSQRIWVRIGTDAYENDVELGLKKR